MPLKKTKNFWAKLPKPFFCLAPMADVTDEAFRLIINKYGKPDVTWTEFTSADGLCDKKGRLALKVNLIFAPKERPIVAQLFTGNPEKMREAAKYVSSLGFDGIDINMGCPDRKIEKGGAGAALIKTPKLAREIIRAAIEGAEGLPVSVKTRLGYNKDELESWLPEILAEDVAAVTIHARTRKEMSDVPAHWDRVKRAVEIRNELKKDVLIIGNGDVIDIPGARTKAKDTSADGVMLGRAIFGNPFLFSNSRELENRGNWAKPDIVKKRLRVMVEHAKLFEKLYGRNSGTKAYMNSRSPQDSTSANGAGRALEKALPRATIKNFAVMKKHFKAYVGGFDGARELRIKLMETSNSSEVALIVKEHFIRFAA
ncbi:MAG: tRNA-dihydrouridine synthase [Candidatus Taylorbacteria bacterium]|nr:tRNA-dihydrouridine synthase [Candidatus Taylorbacteria bacterium]